MYTPSTTFVFDGSDYTPSTDFDFIGGGVITSTLDNIESSITVLTPPVGVINSTLNVESSVTGYVVPIGVLDSDLDNVISVMTGIPPVVGSISSDLDAITVSPFSVLLKNTLLISSTLDDVISSLTAKTVRTLKLSLILEGYDDGLNDFEYRLKSFSTNQNSGNNSTFSFQMPKQAAAVTAYNARPNGDLVVFYLGQEIIRCNPQSFNYNVGATSQTFGIKGSKQETYTSNKTIIIAGNRVLNIKTAITGKRVFTVLDFIDINPLDSIVYDTETIKIEKFSLRVGTNGFEYNLTEI